jgi:hypothetical protein
LKLIVILEAGGRAIIEGIVFVVADVLDDGTVPLTNGLTVVAGAVDEVPANDDTGGDAEMTFPVEGVVDAGNNEAPTDAGKGTEDGGEGTVGTKEDDGVAEEEGNTVGGAVVGGAVAGGAVAGGAVAGGAVAGGAVADAGEGAVTAVLPTTPSCRPIQRREYLNKNHRNTAITTTNAKYIHEFILYIMNLFVSTATSTSGASDFDPFKHVTLHIIHRKIRRSYTGRFGFCRRDHRRRRTHNRS